MVGDGDKITYNSEGKDLYERKNKGRTYPQGAKEAAWKFTADKIATTQNLKQDLPGGQITLMQ
ncbi:hypothetical protein [Photorhabdus luminescens]|uniref:Uncharacterized protein n=1 Tax=Photorhabdus luminescens subsp. sonorensis TaxID=1173677 RepID=A0A5C4RM10_PHOLU|nr:hypothetical protein [Photorhabdus luminescens]TNH44825.1 hypothetical protein EP164_03155 [Photorhabdus luminescens subsp. sonorensis]